MKISTWLAAGALVCAGALSAQQKDPTQEKSSTLNNSANRATDPTNGETERFEAVPGGPATPKKDWKKGDRRGKPRKPHVSRKHVQEKLRKQQQKEAQP